MRPTVVAYVPVLHQGYVSFFKRHAGGELFMVSADALPDFEHLGRDIRALRPEEMRLAILSLGIFSSVHILSHIFHASPPTVVQDIIMPDEDVSRGIAERYFPGHNIVFESVFLRWDMKNATSENAVFPDLMISSSDFDFEVMGRAFAEAKKSPDWWRQVGALVVKNGEVILSAFNQHMPHPQSLYVFGDPRGNFSWGERIEISNSMHAERSIIAQAARSGKSVLGTFLYVTTFPCPVCAMDVAEAGFSRLYYCEGYSLVGAAEILRSRGVEIIRVDRKKMAP